MNDKYAEQIVKLLEQIRDSLVGECACKTSQDVLVSVEPKLKPVKNEEFEIFWAIYPRRVGRGAAQKAFAKARQIADLDVIINKVKEYMQTEQWRDPSKQYIPHAATWLNQRRWEDEVEIDNY